MRTPNIAGCSAQVFKEVKQGRADRLLPLRQGDRRVRVHARVCQRAARSFARGHEDAMTASEKRGALLFFGKAELRVVPSRRRQVERDVQRLQGTRRRRAAGLPARSARTPATSSSRVPAKTKTSVAKSARGDSADRYEFRTAPLRNLAVSAGLLPQRRLREARRRDSLPLERGRRRARLRSGRGRRARGSRSRSGRDRRRAASRRRLRKPIRLTNDEFKDLVRFVRTRPARRARAASRTCAD